MMRSLWTAASGMTAQQRNMDTISNNLANVNTTGYKKERMEFKSLLYETMQSADLDPASQTGRPANLQVGHGVRPAATGRVFTQGNLQSTGYPLDLAIEGDGFFAVDRGGGDIVYTRDGSLKISPTQNGLELVTADGFAYLGTDGEPIYLPVNTLVNDIIVGPDGGITVRDANGQPADTGYQLDLNQFSNMQGLEAVGGNFFKATSASGDPHTDRLESAGLHDILDGARPPILSPLSLTGELEGATAATLVAVASLCLCHNISIPNQQNQSSCGKALILATDPSGACFACVLGT